MKRLILRAAGFGLAVSLHGMQHAQRGVLRCQDRDREPGRGDPFAELAQRRARRPRTASSGRAPRRPSSTGSGSKALEADFYDRRRAASTTSRSRLRAVRGEGRRDRLRRHPQEDPRGMKYEVAERLLFEPGKATLRESGKKVLQRGRRGACATGPRRSSSKATPTTGPSSSMPRSIPLGNLELSGERALNVADFLKKEGRPRAGSRVVRRQGRASIRSSRTTRMPTGRATAGWRSSSSGTRRPGQGERGRHGRKRADRTSVGSCSLLAGVLGLGADRARCLRRARADPRARRGRAARRRSRAEMVFCPPRPADARRAVRPASGSTGSR